MNFPELFQRRMQQLLQNDYEAFIDGYNQPLRRGLRVNTNKIDVDTFVSIFPHALTPSPFAHNSFIMQVMKRK